MSRRQDIEEQILSEFEVDLILDESGLSREMATFRFLVQKISELKLELIELKQDIKFTRDSSIKNLSG